MRKALTSGQVAKQLQISVSAVLSMCDKGLIRYWLIPGSTHRRFDEDEVKRLLKARKEQMRMI